MSKDNNFTKAVKELLGEKENEETSVHAADSSADELYSAKPSSSFTSSYVKSGSQASEYVPPVSSEPITPEVQKPSLQPTYINCDTVINGSITSKTDVKNEGQVNGDITTQQNICVTGKVDGNLDGSSVQIIGGYIIGNVQAKSDVSNDFASIVIGDISCQNLSSDGKIKGNLKIENAVSFKSNAIVCGNITAKKISIQDGAVIKGNVQIVSNKEVDDDVFSAPKSRLSSGDADDFFEVAKHITASATVPAPTPSQFSAASVVSKYETAAPVKEPKVVETKADDRKSAEAAKTSAKDTATAKAASALGSNAQTTIDEKKDDGFAAPSYSAASASTSDLLGSLKQRMLAKDDDKDKDTDK